MKRAKVAKMRVKRKRVKKATMMLERMTMKSMKMKPGEKEKRGPRASSKAPKSAQRRLTHNGVQQHPLLESRNPYEAGGNMLRCIREMQNQGLLNHTPCHQSRSGLLPMPRIASISPTKMAPLGL